MRERSLERVTTCFLLLLMTVFLFAVGPGGYVTIPQVKQGAFYLICGGYCLFMTLMLVAFSGRRLLSALATGLRQTSLTQRLALVYLALTLVSTILSPHRAYSWLGATRSEGLLTITIYCITFVYVARFAQVKTWMLWLFGLCCLTEGMICVLQLKSVNVLSLFPAGYTYWDGDVAYGGKYLGTIGNIDLLAAFLCLAIPLLWSGAVLLREKKRFLLFPPLVLLLYVLARIGVSAGIVGVLGGFVLAFPLVLARSRRTKAVFLSLVALALLGGVVLLYLQDPGGGTAHEVHELLHGRGDASFGSGRLHIWSEVLRRVPARLWFGYGPDTMVLEQLTPFQRPDPDTGIIVVGLIDTAHNEYLNILFHQGVLALTAYMGMLVCGLVRWLRGLGHSLTAAICGCGLLAYAIQACFGISECITAPFFWTILGLLESSTGEAPETGLKI